MSDPKAYLSTANGLWCVIYGGMPLCPMGCRAASEACARQFKLDPATLPVWDGDAGEFRAAKLVQS